MYKDFGRGFYLTPILQHAKEMAIRTTRMRGGVPTVLEYEFDDMNTHGLRCKHFPGANEEWVMFIVNNRNRYWTDPGSQLCNQDAKYDIVSGPIADDGVTLQLTNFHRGNISIETLLKRIQFHQPTKQISFHTVRAISLLKKIGAVK